MPLISDEHAMMVTLKEWLAQQFENEPEAAPEAGAEPLLKRSLPDPKAIVGAPSIVLSLQNDVRSRWAGANGRLRDCAVNIECRANEFAGSIEGVENPEAAQITLARKVRQWIAEKQDELRAVNIDMPELQTLSETGDTVSMRLFFTYDEI